ncbi:ABC transporter permease [Vagococcus xieshaowenii]|uniref:FtsX-like permease family protein n=1 Tax=Vagococcus xieshaowenii TaxID=2562451 RepID=A0A4Z0D2G9_9ENTE|nr:ABC transporter permease [Vagococcus xieshaowenii]QCA29446.1 FtsX-like permease family protein [Vagococcus xieshaowenii]TFZ39518.1 FtsX-like permease family protein [Vagococcus xieshaowenii]
MKISDIIKTANKNLKRNKGRTFLTIIAIFIGAFTIALTAGINTGVNNFIHQQVKLVDRNNLLLINKNSDIDASTDNSPTKYSEKSTNAADDHVLTKKDIENLKKLKWFSDVSPSESIAINYIEGKNNNKFELSAYIDDGTSYSLEAGRQLNNKINQNEILLTTDYVKALGYQSNKEILNKTIQLNISPELSDKKESIKATVVGILAPNSILGVQTTVNKHLSQQILNINHDGLSENLKNQFYSLVATIKDPSSRNIEEIKKDLNNLGYTGQTFEDRIDNVLSAVDAITSVLIIFGAISLLAASFGIINTLYMSVQDRTREIGLMKAMGMSNGKLFLSFTIESVLIGLIGALLGILGAFGSSVIINKVAAKSFVQSFENLSLIQFNATSISLIVLIIVLISFLAGTLPAKRAAKLDPITALRYE